MANFRKFGKPGSERSNSSKNEHPKSNQGRNSESNRSEGRPSSDRRSFGDSSRNRDDRSQRNDDRRTGSYGGGRDNQRGSDRNDDRKPQGDRSFGRSDRQRDDRPNRNDNRKPQGDRSFGSSDRQRGDRPNRNHDRRPQGDRPYGKSDNQRDERPTRNDDRGRDSGDRDTRIFKGTQGKGKTERSGFSKEERPRNNRPEFKKFKPSTDRRVGPENAPRYDEAALRGKMSDRLKEKIEPTEVPQEIRLNKYISNSGLCSRREADELIEAGTIKVNGDVITEMGYKVKDSDTVKYGKDILSRERMMYILLNKPKDFITTMDDPQERKTVMDLVSGACKERVYPVGRLDRNTTGLLLLTNDGELTKKLTHPTSDIKKIYQAELDKPITEEHFELIKDGLELEDGLIKPDQLALVTPDAEVVGIEIHSGKNRIVRRMFEHLGYEVMKLDRTTFAGLTKKDLPRGKWRFLNEKELIRLKYML